VCTECKDESVCVGTRFVQLVKPVGKLVLKRLRNVIVGDGVLLLESGSGCVCVHLNLSLPWCPREVFENGSPASSEDVSFSLPAKPHPQIPGSRDIHHTTISH
jgi:hypothetical protein